MGEAKRRGTYAERKATPKGDLTKPKLKWWQTAKWYHHNDESGSMKKATPNRGRTKSVLAKMTKKQLEEKTMAARRENLKDI